MMLKTLICSLMAVALASAQCDDGWTVYEHHGHCNCFYISPLEEKVTAQDAETICTGQGGWQVKIYNTDMNAWLKNELRKHYEPQILIPGLKFDRQYWIGARVSGFHSDSHYGNWTWTHDGREVDFFDWMPNEPNDWRSQNCMTYLVDQDPLGFGAWHWNDWSCDYVASVICQKTC